MKQSLVSSGHSEVVIMNGRVLVSLFVLLASSIRADNCPSESELEDDGTRQKNTYRSTYQVMKNTRKLGKLPSSIGARFGKLREKYKNLAARIRSLEQPVWFLTRDSNRWKKGCARTCSCHFEKRVLSCWRRDMKYLPSDQGVPHDVKVIDLGMNTFATLHRDTFQSLIALEEIDLSYNKIKYLPVNIFYGLESLLKLKLNGNRFKNLQKDLFFGLYRLRIVDLSENTLNNLPSPLFQQTTNLVSLMARKNHLESLPATIFHGLVYLEELDLSKNRLCNLNRDTFYGLISLKFLNMEENKFVKFADGLFRENVNLNIMSLRKNEIIDVTTLVQNLPSLEFLDLSLNKITRINGDDLANTTVLKELNLHHNRIQRIDPEVFRHAKHLQKLILSANHLTELHFNETKLEHLTYVDLQFNLLKEIDKDLFGRWPNLSEVFLQGNVLNNISGDALKSMSKINTVTLSNNLWNCDCGIIPLHSWMNSNQKKIKDFDNVRCMEPPNWRDQLVNLVDPHDICKSP